MHARAQLISSLVCPISLYSISVSPVPILLLDNLRTVVMNATWGSSRKLRCREIVFTLFTPGHRVDPVQVAHYQCLTTLRQQLQKRPELVEMTWQLLRSYEQTSQRALGPMGMVRKALDALEWTWSKPHCLSRACRPPLPLLDGDNGWWEHQLRDALRISQWKEAGQRRDDMQGLNKWTGVDRVATLALINSPATCAYEKGMLRGIISGSVRLQQRLHQANLADSALCPFCGLEEESLEHCFWRCPCWESIRIQSALPARDIRATWPKCTRECGIFMESEQVLQLAEELEAEEESAESLLREWMQDSPAPAGEETTCNGRVVAWTDGACNDNRDARLSRAGCGIWYSRQHSLNLSRHLPGRVQSNQRAELLAIILALTRDPRAIEIRTDSEYCQTGAMNWNSWRHRKWRGSNQDLWSKFNEAMASRPDGSAVFTWVKGHATNADVQAGRTAPEDKLGNDAVDALAKAGVPPCGS